MTNRQHDGTGPAAHAAGPRPPDRCSLTELLVDQCGHCRTPESAARTDRRFTRPGPWFPASYAGECDTCGEEFEPGDQIRANGEGGWEGRECCGDDDD